MKKKPFILYYLILFMLLTTTNSWGFNKKDIPTMIKKVYDMKIRLPL